MQLRKYDFKKPFTNIVVDIATATVFFIVVYAIVNGLGIMYKGYHETGTLSSDSFSSALSSFGQAIGSYFVIMLLKRYRIEKQKNVEMKEV